MNVDTSSSSSYTNAAYSSKGVSGLVSGIDTESVVESMLMNIQNKIDKQNQTKQQLTWKQEIYRDIISDINGFQSKYLSLTSNTSIRLSTFYNSMKAESSSSAVDVVAESGAIDGDFSMQVARTATASSVTSSKVGTGEVKTSTSKADSFEYDRTVDVKIGDTTHKVDLKGAQSADEIAERINNAAGFDLVTVNKETVKKYRDADGNELTFNEKENKYYNADGEEYTGAVTTSDEEVAKNLKFSATSEFEISGSSVGMSIIGLSGTVKSAVAKDADGKEIEGQYETTSSSVSPQFCETSDKVGGTVDMTLDGVKKSISIREGESMEDFKKKVQSAFGSTVQFAEGADGNWSISIAGTGRNFTISANADTMKAIGFEEGTTTVSNQLLRSDTVGKLGIGDESDTDTKHTFSINGTEIEYTAADTVSTIMNKINSSDAGVKMSYDELSDKFTLNSTSTGAGFDISITGDDEGLFSKLGFSMDGSGSLDSSTVTQGQNAVVNINGVTVERANNSFTYNGLTLNIKSTTGSYEMNPDGTYATNADGSLKSAAGTTENKAEISTDRNVDKMVETFKSFVEDYNKMIEKLNKYTHEKANYKSYAPLTDKQKKEMSEKEIELWEEKSKEGLLRNDRDIESFLTDMRFGLNTTRTSNNVMLSNIGINVSDNWQDYGKLSIDEEQLKKALMNNAEDVADLFLGENGIATKLNKACEETASTSSGRPGALVSLAGVEGKGTEKDNTIQDQLDSIAEKLERLNMLYEARKERYWAQFNAMETAISNMNATSDSIYNTFGV